MRRCSWWTMADSQPLRLAGHVVLITGAESGIGRETALRAASEGADIAAVGLDSSGLDILVDQVRATGGRAAAKPADVSDADALTAAIDELVGELGLLSVAHANAGILTPATSITDLDLDEWNRVLAVDLTGVMLTFRTAIPHFRVGGRLAASDRFVARPATKHRTPVICRGEGRRARHRPEPGARARAAKHPGQRDRTGTHRDSNDPWRVWSHRTPARRSTARSARTGAAMWPPWRSTS